MSITYSCDNWSFTLASDWELVSSEDGTQTYSCVEGDKIWFKTVTSDPLGSTTSTTDATQIRSPKVFIREGSYQPEWLGLYLHGVKWLNVGFCRARPDEGVFGFENQEIAHVHLNTGDICFSNGAYLFSDEGMVDDVLIHEYCHILRGDAGWDSHDQEWKELVVQYGLKPVTYTEYVYKGC